LRYLEKIGEVHHLGRYCSSTKEAAGKSKTATYDYCSCAYSEGVALFAVVVALITKRMKLKSHKTSCLASWLQEVLKDKQF